MYILMLIGIIGRSDQADQVLKGNGHIQLFLLE